MAASVQFPPLGCTKHFGPCHSLQQLNNGCMYCNTWMYRCIHWWYRWCTVIHKCIVVSNAIAGSVQPILVLIRDQSKYVPVTKRFGLHPTAACIVASITGSWHTYLIHLLRKRLQRADNYYIWIRTLQYSHTLSTGNWLNTFKLHPR